MFRRSRFSVRPNVSTAGRTAATSQEPPSANQEAGEAPSNVSESTSSSAVTDNKSVVTPSEKSAGPGDACDQNGEGSSSSAAVQRRKRFSVKPKVAPGRPATIARTPKSPVKAVTEPPVEASGSDIDKPSTSNQTTATPQGLQLPKRRRPSEDIKQPKVLPRPRTSIPSDNSAPSAVPPAEKSLEQTHLTADSGKQSESTSGSQVKEVPPRPPDRVPPIIPDKDATELSEKAKTLVSSKSGVSLSPSALSLSRLLNDPSDLQRLAKAQKLRELLKQEKHKEKRLKKAKARAKEYTLDPAKMTMRDLIHYIPTSNPMTSSLEQSTQENETVVPASPAREESPERAQEPEVLPKMASSIEEENEEADEEQEEALMVPQVKVAEDGSLIIDEESLTVEVQRAKGPNPAQDREPIFERGSTTTYSSFRKGISSKPWSSEETDMFFLAISMVGTDFSMICQLFPHRARAEIKNKFKKEERVNSWRVDKAFKERRKLDIEFFSKLLEKILEVQKNKKKLKSLAEKNTPKKQKKKAKGRKAARTMSDVEEEDEEDENLLDLEDEEGGEKENELLCNEEETNASKPKRQQKRKTGKDSSHEEQSNKKHKSSEKSTEQAEASTPEDTEAVLPENPINADMSEKTENVDAKDTAIKPAKLSRGRAPKPLMPLSRKWGKKVLPPSTKTSDNGEEGVSDGASKEQVNIDSSPSRISANDEISSEEEEAAVPPPRPTRYGRVPKPTKQLTYPCKEDEHSSASETCSSALRNTASAAKPKPKCTAKRGRSSMTQLDQESKKLKLVTLRASQSDYSDEENEQQWEQEKVQEEEHPSFSQENTIASAFVPASLRSPHPKMSEVEETMEELDILANMPDVLGISQDALCPDASCEQAHNEMGTAEPCEHQLDLLVDVIDFLSSEQTEVSEDESYNEAAQTLLTIGNLFQATQTQIATQERVTGTTLNNETSQRPDSETPSNPPALEQSATSCQFAASGNGITETSEAIATVELQNSTAESADNDQICNEQWTGSNFNCNSQLQSSPESLSMMKPKLSQLSRTAQLKSQPETSATIKSVIDLAPAEVTLKIPEGALPSLKDCTEIKLTEQPSGNQEGSLSKTESNHHFSEGQFAPNFEPINQDSESVSSSKDEKPMSEIMESGSNNSGEYDKSVTEPQVEQKLKSGSDLGQEDSSAGFVTPVEDIPVSQKAQNQVASTLPSRRSRLQKVKPKPNLPQTSRTARSKPQVTTDSLKKDSSPVPTAKTPTEVNAEQTGATLPEEATQSTGPALDVIPSLDLCSTFTPSEKLSTTNRKNTDGIGSVSKSTNAKCISHAEILGASPANSELSVTEPQVGQGSNTYSVSVEEDSTGFVTLVEDLPVSQKAESKVASPCQSKSTRLQKVRPKPNLTQTSITARSRSQITKDSLEKDSSPSPVAGPVKNTATFPEKTPQSTVAASDLMPSLDFSILLPTEEFTPHTTEVKNKDVRLSGQEDSSAATPGQRASENQDLSRIQDQFQPSDKQASAVTKPTFKPVERGCSDPVTSDSAVAELKVGEEFASNLDSQPESSDNTVAEVEAHPTCSAIIPEKPSQSTASVSGLSLELCTTHKPTEDSSSESSEPNVPQRRRRFPKVKPNLASSLRTAQTKLHHKEIGENSQCHMHAPSTREQQSVDNNSAHAELETKSQVEKVNKHLMSVHSVTTEPLNSTKSAAELQTSLGSTNDKCIPSDGIILAPSSVVLLDSVPENKSSEKSTGDKMLSDNEVMDRHYSEGNIKVDVSTGTELNIQPVDDSAAFPKVQSSEDGSTQSEINSALTTNMHSTQDTEESSPQSSPKSDTEEMRKDASQCSETSEANQILNKKSQSAHSNNESQSKSTASFASLRKAPSTPRGRLIKPKPNLRRGSQPPKPQVQNPTQAGADSVTCSKGVEASVSELKPDKKPVEGAVEQHSSQDSHPDCAGSSLSCLKHASEQLRQQDTSLNDAGSSCLTPIPSTQNASTSGSEGTQSYPCLNLFPDMLSKQVPSDPNEPFFILSLTEIPACPSVEVVGSATEPLSYLPVTDASILQQSLEGERLKAAAGDRSLSDATVPVSTEESAEMSLINVKDTGPDPDSHTQGKNEAEHEMTTVQPDKFSETVQNNNDTGIPPTKQRLRNTRRGVKLQVKQTRARPKEASQTLVTNTIQDPHHTEPSVQPEASDATAKAGDEDVTKPQNETLTCANDSGSGEPTRITKTRSQARKPKDVTLLSETNATAHSVDPPPGKALSTSTKVKRPRAAGKRSGSTPHNVAPAPSTTHLTDKSPLMSSTTSPTQTEVDIEQNSEHRQPTEPTTSTSYCTAEVSAAQQSDFVETSSIEEPTNVSQYFLSDIFTEVEDG